MIIDNKKKGPGDDKAISKPSLDRPQEGFRLLNFPGRLRGQDCPRSILRAVPDRPVLRRDIEVPGCHLEDLPESHQADLQEDLQVVLRKEFLAGLRKLCILL